jgi:hypothetical protein
MRTYELSERDRDLVNAANGLLRKIANAETTSPAQLVSIAKLLHVFSLLPRTTTRLEMELSLTSPSRKFGDYETFPWWDVGIQEGVLSISSAGHRTGPNGGDSFPTMTRTAAPGEPAEFKDYRDSLTMVPDVWAFPDAVERIDLASVGYEGRIEDEENR